MRRDIADYLRIAGQHWLTILGTAVAALAVAALWILQTPAQYQSTTALFFSATSQDTGGGQEGTFLPSQRVASYAELVTRQAFARSVIDELDLRMDPEALSERVTATAKEGTVVLELSVTDANPQRARLLTKTLAEQLTELVARLEEPGASGGTPIKATVVEEASLPGSPVSPRPALALPLAAVLGVLLGFGIAIMRELLDKSMKTPGDVEGAVDVGVIAHIPYDSKSKREPLVNSAGPNRARAEAFRVLRTNLEFVDLEESTVFVVTSSIRREGKTTTAANLAIALAEAGRKVLLLDADLRRPTVAQMLELAPSPGLTTVLAGDLALDDALQVGAPLPALSVLTSGLLPANPSELLQSSAMSEVLSAVRDRYDAVIVDSPPLLPVTDAALLAAQADGVLVVLQHGRITEEQLRLSMQRIRAVGGRCVGVVLNMVPPRGLYGQRDGKSPGSRNAGVSQQDTLRAMQTDTGACESGVTPQAEQANESVYGQRQRRMPRGHD